MKLAAMLVGVVCMSYVHGYTNDAVLLVSGPLHTESTERVRELPMDLSSQILLREFGLEETTKKVDLPTGDIFNRPDAAVYFLLHNVGMNDITTPKLGHLILENPVFKLKDEDESCNNDVTSRLFTTRSKLNEVSYQDNVLFRWREEFPDALIHSFSGNTYTAAEVLKLNGKTVAKAETHSIFNRKMLIPSDEMIFFKREVDQVINSNEEKIYDNQPDLFIFGIKSCNVEDLELIERELFEIIQKFEAVYGTKLVTNIALLGSDIPNRRGLQETGSNSTTLTEVDAIDYIILVWTVVFIALTLFFVFCCIDWQAEMDPILYSTLKDEK